MTNDDWSIDQNSFVIRDSSIPSSLGIRHSSFPSRLPSRPAPTYMEE